MKKVINIFIVSLALFSVLSLSVITAYATPAVELVTVSDFVAYTDTGAATRPTFTTSKYESYFQIVTSVPAVIWKGYSFTLNYPAYMKVDSGYYFQLSITTRQVPPSITPSFKPTTTVVVTTSDGVMYNLGVSTELQSSSQGNSYVAIAGGYVGNGQPLHISSIEITSDCPVNTASMSAPNSYDITVYPSISVVPTPEQQRHEELMGEIQQSTNEITGAIEDATDDFLNGYDPDDGGSKDDFDSATGELEDAESNLFPDGDPDSALDDIGDAFDEDPFQELNPASSQWVSLYLTQLLGFLGKEYTALIFISCLLGIALLAIGRIL